MDLEVLIGRAKQGDLDAFAEVTRRFQHMAFGYALSIVRDLQQTEDVVQEAFVAAWFGLLEGEGFLRKVVVEPVEDLVGGIDEVRARAVRLSTGEHP